MAATNDIPESDDYVSIPEFYNGKSVFITGATGFLGKILVEKLLRSCPGIENIYLLVRPKKMQSTPERLNNILSSKAFDLIKETKPEDLAKVQLIDGDLTAHELGISKSDQELLQKTVSVVFHSAATIRFNEKLQFAVATNMVGTKNIIQLCQKLPSLEAFVYVSTAYCNCDRSDIDEIVYKPPFDPNAIISLSEWSPAGLMEKITPILTDKRPNTYTFTKALGEQIVFSEARGKIPVCIVRPSIVGASYEEPFPGWLDNFGGPAGCMYATGKGVLHTIHMEPNANVDVIPADIVINVIIAAAWRTAISKLHKKLPLYNCVMNRNAITWGKFMEIGVRKAIQHPLEDVLWYTTISSCSSRTFYKISSFFLHFIPALFLDIFSTICGNKAVMVKMIKRMNKEVDLLRFFLTNEWNFEDSNVRALLRQMSKADRDIFRIDTSAVEWEKYMEDYWLGIRRYLLKQKPETLPKARKHLKTLYYCQQSLKVFLMILFSCLLWYIMAYVIW